MSTDHNEALRLAEILEGGSPQFNHEAAALLRQQAERIAELEREVAANRERDALKIAAVHIHSQLRSIVQAGGSDEAIGRCFRKQVLRDIEDEVAQLRAEVLEQARCNGMGAERELALTAERDKHKATFASLLFLLADIRMACGDNGKRMQPELVEFIGAMKAERDQLRAEVSELRAALWHVKHAAKDIAAAKAIAGDALDAARTTHKDEG